MTVETQTNVVVYTGDGVATEFPFTFPVYDSADVTVYLQLISTGEIDQTLNSSEFTVSGVDDPNGGSVTIIGTPVANTHKIIIARLVDYTQDLDVPNEGGFYPENFEIQLDLIEMQIQQLREEVRRSVKGFIGETFADLPAAIGRQNKFIGFDGSGILGLFDDTGSASTFSLDNVLRVPEDIPEIADAATRANKFLKFDSGGDPALAVGSATLADGDYGSVTVSVGGTVITINNLAVVTAMLAAAAVTYAKIQNVSASDKILGRVSSGAGVIEEITFTDLAQTLAAITTAPNYLTALGFSSFFQTLIDETTGGAILALLGGANGTITAGSLANPGYVVFEASALLGADLMIQWGNVTVSAGQDDTITYGQPFSTFAVCACIGGTATNSKQGDLHSVGVSGTTTQAVSNSNVDESVTASWIAIGDK